MCAYKLSIKVIFSHYNIYNIGVKIFLIIFMLNRYTSECSDSVKWFVKLKKFLYVSICDMILYILFIHLAPAPLGRWRRWKSNEKNRLTSPWKSSNWIVCVWLVQLFLFSTTSIEGNLLVQKKIPLRKSY